MLSNDQFEIWWRASMMTLLILNAFGLVRGLSWRWDELSLTGRWQYPGYIALSVALAVHTGWRIFRPVDLEWTNIVLGVVYLYCATTALLRLESEHA